MEIPEKLGKTFKNKDRPHLRWPGNVRELENTIARACALASSDVLLPSDMPFATAPGAGARAIGEAIDTLLACAPQSVNVLEWAARELIGRVIDRNDGDLRQSAASIGATQAELRRFHTRQS